MLKTLRPNENRAKTALILLYIMLALEVVMLVSNLLQYILIEDINAGKFIGDDTIDANDTRQQMIAIVYVVAYVGSAICFIMWFRRAYFNLGQRIRTEYDEGWAAGGWFVPIISLYYPYKIMKELYTKTNALLRDHFSGYDHKVSITTLGVWWGLWIFSNIFERILNKIDAETIEGVLNHTMASMASTIFGIILAFIAIKVVKDYHELEKKYFEMAAQQATEQSPPPQIIL